MSSVKLLTLTLVFGAAIGCQENPIVHPINLTPIAIPQVLDAAGMPIRDPAGKPADTAQFDLVGSEVEVTLDGSASTDADGRIVKYQWLSGTAPAVGDGGMAMKSDSGVAAHRVGPDPADTIQSKVQLGEGVWTFLLAVTDDRGAVSLPAKISITVGKPSPLADPSVKACYDAADQTVTAKCRTCLCAVSDACRTAVPACDGPCWALINCLGSKCPNFRAMAAQMPPDYSCLTGMCGAEYGMGGGTKATAVSPCLTVCPDECKASAPDAGH